MEDRESGNNLTEILSGFNMYFLSYNGSREQTRLQVPMSIRKTGLWITYVLYDKTVVTEWYAGEAIDDNSWKNLSNWRVGSNMLVGDISISSDGYWVVNGVVTTTKAQGEQGITPMLRVGSNNHLQVSYTNGSSWVDASTSPVYTQFRINNNKLEQSVDLGQTWAVVSDYIASWFRFTGTSGSSQVDNVGKIQISRDNGTTWSDLSGEFTNSLHIKGYVATASNLPSTAVQGDIYGVGPTYDPSDTGQINPIYELYVKDSTGWVNNGRFTSISAGVVQETGNSETAVMSQAGVTNALALAELSNSYELNKYVKEIVLATPIAEGVTINRVTMHFGSVTGAKWYNALFIYTSAGGINVFTNTYATQQECYDNAYGVFGTGGNYCLIDYRELDKGHNTDILDITTFNHPLTIQFAPNIDNYLQDNSISTITNLETWQGQMNKNTLTQNQTFNNVVKELYVSNPADFDISNLSHIICHKGSVTGSQFYNALFIYPRTGSGIGVFSENYATKEECFQNAIGLKKGDRNYCIIDYSSLNEGATQFNADILKFNHNLDLIYAPSIGNYIQNNSIITEFTNNTEINTCIKELYLPGVNQKDIIRITIQKGSPSGNTFYR